MTDLDPLTPAAQASYDRFTADLETGAAARRAAWAYVDFAVGPRPGRTPLSPAQFADAHAAVRAGLDRLTAHAPRWAHWTDFVARVEAAVAGAPRTHDGIRAALWRALSDATAVEYKDAALELVDRAVTAPSAHVRRLGDDPARLVAAWVAIHGIAGEVGTARAIRDLGWCIIRAAAVTGVDTAPLLPSRPPTAAQRAEARARANAAGRRAADAPPAGAPVDPADVQAGDVAWNPAGVRARVVTSWPSLGRVLIEDGGDEVVVESARLSFVRPPAPEPEAPAVEEPAPVAVPVRRGLGPVRVSDGEHAAVVERWDVADTIRPWFPGAPEEVVAAVAELQAALDERPAVSARAAAVAAGLGITVEPEPEGAPVDADPWADASPWAAVEAQLESARREVDELRAELAAANAALARRRALRGEDVDTDAAERAVDEVLAADERDGIRR